MTMQLLQAACAAREANTFEVLLGVPSETERRVGARGHQECNLQGVSAPGLTDQWAPAKRRKP